MAKAPYVSIQSIVSLVARISGLTVADLKGASKQREVCRWRRVTYWLCRQYSARSYPVIAREVGERDHSTIVYGVRTLDLLIKAQKPPPELCEALAELQSLISRRDGSRLEFDLVETARRAACSIDEARRLTSHEIMALAQCVVATNAGASL